MPEISSISSQKLIKVLNKKGFLLDRTKGSHYIFYQPETKQRLVVPFHKKDLILKQAGIKKEELIYLL